MTLTIDIPADLVAKVTTKTLAPEEVSRVLDAVAAAAPASTGAFSEEKWNALISTLTEGLDSPDREPLSDYAVSRDAIYEDHP